jgi:hypothetical protein
MRISEPCASSPDSGLVNLAHCPDLVFVSWQQEAGAVRAAQGGSGTYGIPSPSCLLIAVLYASEMFVSASLAMFATNLGSFCRNRVQ